MPHLLSSARPVLIVDDEDLYLRLLREDLTRRGCQVTACRDLDSAVLAYRSLEAGGGRFAMVVDLLQPGEGGGCLGGLDLLRRVRPPAGREVVALVDSEAGWLETAATSLGATRTVRKPDLRRTEPEHLDRALRQFLSVLAGEAVEEPVAGPAASPASFAEAVPDALLGALEELRHLRGRDAILLLVMRLAAELTARGVLFDVRGDGLQALGSFGLGDEAENSLMGEPLRLDRDTLPGRAFWSARLQRASGASGVVILPPLPGPPPQEAFSLPILGPLGVIAVLYGDCGTAPSLPDLRGLSALAGTASLALECAREPVA